MNFEFCFQDLPASVLYACEHGTRHFACVQGGLRTPAVGRLDSFALPGGVFDDLAFFHHERDALGCGDVGGGIAGDGDDVGLV